jgi:hypothetical protein
MISNENLLFNPSFTFNVNGWTTVGNSSITIYTSDSYSSAQSLQVTKKNENDSGIAIKTEYRPDVIVGTTYVASAYVRIPSTEDTSSLAIAIKWYDVDGSLLSTNTATSTSITAGGSWTRLSISAVAPTNSIKASVLVLQPTSGTNAKKFLVDSLKFEIGSTPTEVVQVTDQGQKNKITNLALQNVYINHLKGMQLNADIILNDFLFNTIDEYGVVWVITDIKGWNELPPAEIADFPRGFGDGSYLGLGRYAARDITIEGVFLPQDAATQVAPARDRLLEAINFVKKDGWLIMKESPVKAARVRLSGAPEIATVNARGRTEFSIGLKAGDPIKYKWNAETKDNYYSESISANNQKSIFNDGNTPVPAIFEIIGPTTGKVTITNKSSDESLETLYTLRNSKELGISATSITDSTATFTISDSAHGLEPGDTVDIVDVIDVVELQTAFNKVSTGHVVGRTSVKHNFAVGQIIRFKDLDVSSNPILADNTLGTITDIYPGVDDYKFKAYVGGVVSTNNSYVLDEGAKCLVYTEPHATEYDKTTKQATITTTGKHGYKVGDIVVLYGCGTVYNGTYSVEEIISDYKFKVGISSVQTWSTVASYSGTTVLSTLAFSSNPGVLVGDYITVFGVNKNFDGTYLVTATSNAGGTYYVNYENRLDTAVSLTSGSSKSKIYISSPITRTENILATDGKSYYGNVYNSNSYSVVSIPSAKSFTVSIPLSYDLTSSSLNDWTPVAALVRWRTERLTIDTYSKSVAINDVVSGYRSKLDTLVDWIQLYPGNNVISFEDTNRFYISKIELNNGSSLAWITTKDDHGLVEGSVFSITGLASNYQSAFSAASYTVTQVLNSKKFKFTNTYVASYPETSVTSGYIKEVSSASLNIYYRPGWIT